MEIQITPNDVDQIVKDAIIKSVIGDTIQKHVAAALSGYDSPVKKAVATVVNDVARELIEEKAPTGFPARAWTQQEKNDLRQVIEEMDISTPRPTDCADIGEGRATVLARDQDGNACMTMVKHAQP